MKTWTEAVSDAALTGSLACVATAAGAALCGLRDSGSAVAPINATSHVVWGEAAAAVEDIDWPHTALGFAVNYGASAFWAALYEKLFGAAAERRDVGTAAGGALAVTALAYLTDYHVVPKRLTPGWEKRIRPASLALVYGALAVSLPLRGLLRTRL
jgi:hypothetical protein